MQLKTLLVVLTVTSLAACTVGSGDMSQSEREVSGFDRISLSTSGDVIVQVTGTESLEVEAEDNILPLLTTDVVDGVLVLGSDRPFSTNRGITYRITAETLTGIEVSGSGDVEALAIDASTFTVAISGSGSVEPSGVCDTLGVDVSGSGTFVGTELECGVGGVSVSGSGDASVDISDVLDADISGSGSIEYLGDPELRSDVTGSGSIRQG